MATTPDAAAELEIRPAQVPSDDLGFTYDASFYLVATNGAGRLPAAETWGRIDTLDDHFLRHGADFGASTADEYAALASDFFESGIARGLPTRSIPRQE
jgi:pyocin large subunit-like protein